MRKPLRSPKVQKRKRQNPKIRSLGWLIYLLLKRTCVLQILWIYYKISFFPFEFTLAVGTRPCTVQEELKILGVAFRANELLVFLLGAG